MEESNDVVENDFNYYLSATKKLWNNENYLICVFTLVCQFFTTSVFLFWGTQYFKLVLSMNQTSAMVAIGIIVSTAPLIGVFCGGYLADRIPGRSQNFKETYYLAFQLTLLGYIFNDILTFVN